MSRKLLEKPLALMQRFRAGSEGQLTDSVSQSVSADSSDENKENDVGSKTKKKDDAGKRSIWYITSSESVSSDFSPLVSRFSTTSVTSAISDFSEEHQPIERKSSTRTQPHGTIEIKVPLDGTLNSIAAHYDTTPSELIKLNKLGSRMVFPGQMLWIPDPDYTTSSEPSSPDMSTSPVFSPPADERPRVDIPIVRMADKPPARVPGHVERQTPVSSPQEKKDFDFVPRKLSEEDVQTLDQECYERFIKIQVKHITDGQGVVNGTLLVTPNAVMFDPNVSDPLVIEHGSEKYGMITPMDMVISAAMYHDIAAMKMRGRKTDDESSASKHEIYHTKDCPLHHSGSATFHGNIDHEEVDGDSNMKHSSTADSVASSTTTACSCGALSRQQSVCADLDVNKSNQHTKEGETEPSQLDNVADVEEDDDATKKQSADNINKNLDPDLSSVDASATPVDLENYSPEVVNSIDRVKNSLNSVDISPDSNITEKIIPKVKDDVDSDIVADRIVVSADAVDNADSVDSTKAVDDINAIHDTKAVDDVIKFKECSDTDSKTSNSTDKTVPKLAPDSGNKDEDFIRKESVLSSSGATGVEFSQSGAASDHSESQVPNVSVEKVLSENSENPVTSDLSDNSVISVIKSLNLPNTSLDAVCVENGESRIGSIVYLPVEQSKNGEMVVMATDSLVKGSKSVVEESTNDVQVGERAISDSNVGVRAIKTSAHHLSSFVNYATGLFRSNVEDRLNVKDISEVIPARVSSDSTGGSARPLQVSNAISLEDKPELFTTFDKLIARPATHAEDPPLYLCLRVGHPKNKEVSQTCPIESYRATKKKPEYWFSIPRAKVDALYAFFVQWTPDIYGDQDDIDPEIRGFVVIDEEEDTEDENLEIIDEHFASIQKIRKDWEIISKEEALRRMSTVDESVTLPEMIGETTLLTEDHLRELSKNLPPRTIGYPWTLIYSTELHGFSLKTLYRCMSGIDSPILLVVMDTSEHVFGAVTSCAIKMSDHFYGTGESFLFTFYPEFKVFHWTGENNFFLKGNQESLAIGAGQGLFGLWFDGDLYHGRSHRCETFDNDVLTDTEDFVVKGLEAWAFV